MKKSGFETTAATAGHKRVDSRQMVGSDDVAPLERLVARKR